MTLTHLSIWAVNVVSVKSAVTPKITVNYVHTRLGEQDLKGFQS